MLMFTTFGQAAADPGTTTAPTSTSSGTSRTAYASRYRGATPATYTTGERVPTTGYRCTSSYCQGYGDTADLFAHLADLVNQATPHVTDVGQPAPLPLDGRIDGNTQNAIWWLHGNTVPELFPELNSSAGDFNWMSQNATQLVGELSDFMSHYQTPSSGGGTTTTSTTTPGATSGGAGVNITQPNGGPPSGGDAGGGGIVDLACPDGMVVTASGCMPAPPVGPGTILPGPPSGGCPVGTIWDRDHGVCYPTSMARKPKTGLLIAGGVAAGVLLAILIGR